LGAELENPLLVLDDLPQGFGQAIIERQRFLAIDILAGLGRRNGHRGVPVVVNTNDDRVHIRPRQHFAEIGVRRGGALAIVRVELGGGIVAPGLEGIRHGDNPHVGHLAQGWNVIVAADVAAADLAEADAVAGGLGTKQRGGHDVRHGEDGAGTDGLFEEAAS